MHVALRAFPTALEAIAAAVGRTTLMPQLNAMPKATASRLYHGTPRALSPMMMTVTCTASASASALSHTASSLSRRSRPFHSTRPGRMFIQTQETPNPSALQFLPGRVVLEEEYGSGMNFTTYGEAQESALAKRLFQLEGVTNVFLGREFITINVDIVQLDWHLAKPQIFAIIMDFFAEDIPVMGGAPTSSPDTMVHDDDSEVVAMIKELIETRIRPSVQEDGGDIYFRKFDEDTGCVFLELAGSCAGCPSSEITLKHGVENMLKYYVPEVVSIMAIDQPDVDVNDDQELADYDRKLSFKPQE